MKRTCFSLLLTAVLVTAGFAAEPVSRRDAARLQAKLDRITKSPGQRGAVAAKTPISEAELNSYLRLELGDRMPAGVKDPWVSLLEGNRLSGSATVDLAAGEREPQIHEHARSVQLPQRLRSCRRQRRAADAKRRRIVLPRVGVDLGSAGASVDAPGNRHAITRSLRRRRMVCPSTSHSCFRQAFARYSWQRVRPSSFSRCPPTTCRHHFNF